MDDGGNPVAVLDWKYMKLAPLFFLTRPPVFIDSADELYEPTRKDVGCLESIDSEERAKYVKDNKEWYAEHLNDYQCTMLRQVYQERAEAVADYFPDFDRELLDHVVCFSWQAEDHIE